MECVKYRVAELIPGAILARKDLTLAAKRIYAQIRYSQAGSRSVSLSQSWMASKLNLSRQAVGRGVGLLIDRGLLELLHTSKAGSVFSVARLANAKKFFLPLDINDSGHTESETIVFAYLKFRQGTKDHAWPHISTICDDLGLSRATISRTIKSLETAGYIRIKHAHGGLKQGNKYQITAKPFFVTRCDTRSQSGASKCNTYNNTYRELKENHNPAISKQQEIVKKSAILRQHGVAYPVARAISQEHTLQNVENAAINAVCQQQLAQQQGRKFNLAAYLVGILNKSARQGCKISLNLFAKQEVEKFREAERAAEVKRSIGRAISQAAADRVLAELKQRNHELATGTASRNVSDEIRRMLGVA
jgi:DNA-binding MarR family transcriptional regulator